MDKIKLDDFDISDLDHISWRQIERDSLDRGVVRSEILEEATWVRTLRLNDEIVGFGGFSVYGNVGHCWLQFSDLIYNSKIRRILPKIIVATLDVAKNDLCLDALQATCVKGFKGGKRMLNWLGFTYVEDVLNESNGQVEELYMRAL